MSRTYSKEDCIESLQEAAKRSEYSYLSKDIYVNEFNNPSVRTLGRIFGSWTSAKKAAGLEIKKSPTLGGVPDNRNYSKDEWESLGSNRRKRERKKSYLGGIKVNSGCAKCGYDDRPAALTFHHINPEKKHEILQNTNRTFDELPWKDIDDEIDKCEVLCANCHFVEEWDDNRWDIENPSTDAPLVKSHNRE